jgi:hypothetical protein
MVGSITDVTPHSPSRRAGWQIAASKIEDADSLVKPPTFATKSADIVEKVGCCDG